MSWIEYYSYKLLSFKPFDPVIKRVESKVEDPSGSELLVSKGAPQAILALVLNKDGISARVDESVKRLASKGFRSFWSGKDKLARNLGVCRNYLIA